MKTHNLNLHNLKLRFFSSLFIGSVMAGAIIIGGLFYYFIMFLIMAGMLYEWYNITNSSLLALIFGSIIIPISIASLILLELTNLPSIMLLYYFVIVWTVDTFAMLGGNFFGGPKLAPKISPKKTWSGLFCGVASASLVMGLLLNCLPANLASNFNYSISNILFVIILGFIAQMSDLLVSIFKRRFGVKESGTIIPGHGGILDRFDSIILTAPLSLMFWLYYVL